MTNMADAEYIRSVFNHLDVDNFPLNPNMNQSIISSGSKIPSNLVRIHNPPSRPAVNTAAWWTDLVVNRTYVEQAWYMAADTTSA